MAETKAAAGLTVEQWDEEYFEEYTQENLFSSEMGRGQNNIIQVKESLTKKKGDTIHFALVNRLIGDGVTGSEWLEGEEEAMSSRSFAVTVDKLRHASLVSEMEEQKSAISLRDAQRSGLKTWSMEKLRNDVIGALHSKDGKLYADASEAEKDTWVTNNSDRVLFGKDIGNLVAGDHSASLANVDSTNDKFNKDALSKMKRMALIGSPKITPVTDKKGARAFMFYAHPLAFRDFRTESEYEQMLRDAEVRGKDNPLFKSGDLWCDGCIIREVDDIPIIEGVGAGGIDVAPVFCCGLQAVGIAWAKRTNSVVKTFDYGDKYGVAIEEIRGIEKLRFGTGAADTTTPKDHGVLTGYFAAVGDE